MSFLFSSIVLFVTLFSKYPIHPAIYITFDLICGLYLIATGITISTLPIHDLSGFICDGIPDSKCKDISSNLVGVRWTGVALVLLNR
jgi:hypothetical protein